jgi:hypothetical protein
MKTALVSVQIKIIRPYKLHASYAAIILKRKVEINIINLRINLYELRNFG